MVAYQIIAAAYFYEKIYFFRQEFCEKSTNEMGNSFLKRL